MMEGARRATGTMPAPGGSKKKNGGGAKLRPDIFFTAFAFGLSQLAPHEARKEAPDFETVPAATPFG